MKDQIIQTFKRLPLFRTVITVLVVLCLALQISNTITLRRTRSKTQPIIDRSDDLVKLADQGPYISEARVKLLLALAGSQLASMAEGHIQYTVHISQTVLIATDIAVNERIPVPISLVVSNTLPVKAEIPFREQIVVPVDLEIDQVFPISTSVPFQDEIIVHIDDVVSIDEKFETRLLGQTIKIPIRGDIPVQLTVVVPIDKVIPVRTSIPVHFPISETLPVDINLMIPVDLEIPVNLPIETSVTVLFSRTIPINVAVPIVLDVPIDIAIGDTFLGEFLRDLGEQLGRMVD